MSGSPSPRGRGFVVATEGGRGGPSVGQNAQLSNKNLSHFCAK